MRQKKIETMFTLEKCKQILKDGDYSDEEIYEIRKILYQLGEMLFDEFMDKKTKKNDESKKIKGGL